LDNRAEGSRSSAELTEIDHASDQNFYISNGGGSSYHMLNGTCVYNAIISTEQTYYLHVSDFDLAESASLTVNGVEVTEIGTTEISSISDGILSIEFKSSEDYNVISGRGDFHTGYVACVSEYAEGCEATETEGSETTEEEETLMDSTIQYNTAHKSSIKYLVAFGATVTTYLSRLY